MEKQLLLLQHQDIICMSSPKLDQVSDISGRPSTYFLQLELFISPSYV